MSANQQVLAGLGGGPKQQSYTTPGTYTWVCPAGVTAVSVLCVQPGGTPTTVLPGNGGGLNYRNNYAVTPGNSYTVVVGSDLNGASPNSYFESTSVCSNTPSAGTRGGNGGLGDTIGGTLFYWGGGGAAGYAGNGSNGGSGLNGAGGGGAGGGGNATNAAGGGGVGILGQGANGTWQSGGGSGGGDAVFVGGNYGGGGGYIGSTGYAGGSGAVRIIWPGNLRQFPSTRTANE